MHLHDDDGRDVIPPIPHQSPQNFTPPPLYYPPLKPKSKKGRNILIAVAALVVLIIIAAIASPKSNGGAPNATATDISATNTPVTNASDPLAVGAAPVAAPSTQAPAPVKQQVTYSCTGKAPDGIDITYGPDGSNHQATTLPFTKSADLDSTALYYDVTAQLQGGGSVSCTTTVTYDDGSGTAQTVTKSGSADGGYNIASAEICTGFDSSFIPC